MKTSELLAAVRDPQRIAAHLRFRARQAAEMGWRIQHGFRRSFASRGLPLTANDRRQAAFRDRHRRRRAVVIGNGPSLRVSDLDRLRDEITFASNKIYLAFDETQWRPTYYSVTDVLVAQNNRDKIASLEQEKIFGDSVKAVFRHNRDISWLHELGNPDPERGPAFSDDLFHGVWGGFSVIFIQLQIAFFMGIREVYLIGVDFSFSVPKATGETSIHGAVLESSGEVNHFHPDYRKPGEKWTMPHLDGQRRAFIYAKDAFDEAGGTIVNCSRQTQLDVIERQDFDKVFPEKL